MDQQIGGGTAEIETKRTTCVWPDLMKIVVSVFRLASFHSPASMLRSMLLLSVDRRKCCLKIYSGFEYSTAKYGFQPSSLPGIKVRSRQTLPIP